MRALDVLSEREALANKEEPGRVDTDPAENLRDRYLAPVSAAAFATRDPSGAFPIGLAASLGAGASVAFAEALTDDDKLSGSSRSSGRPSSRPARRPWSSWA